MMKVMVPRNGPEANRQLIENTASVCKRLAKGMDSGANSTPSTIVGQQAIVYDMLFLLIFYLKDEDKKKAVTKL